MLGLLLLAALIAVIAIVLGIAVKPILFILLVAAAIVVAIGLVRRTA
jgi:hypothetical protein